MFDLKEEIAKARREMRLAQGQPRAEEEQEAKRREKAMGRPGRISLQDHRDTPPVVFGSRQSLVQRGPGGHLDG